MHVHVPPSALNVLMNCIVILPFAVQVAPVGALNVPELSRVLFWVNVQAVLLPKAALPFTTTVPEAASEPVVKVYDPDAPPPTMRLPDMVVVAVMLEIRPPLLIVTAAAVIVLALHVSVPVIDVVEAAVNANDDAAEVLRVAPVLMVTRPNCIEALPRVEVPAALKVSRPLEWVYTVGLFQTAPANVKAVAPVPDGATSVPADAKRLPVITSDVAVVMVMVAEALMVVVPVIVLVPVLVVTAPLVPPPTMRLPAAVKLYVEYASVVPSLTVTL